MPNNPADIVTSFIEEASVPLHTLHVAGTLDRAEKILRSNPELAAANIFAAAIVGNHEIVGRLVDHDKQLATAKGGPRGWDPLTYLCFSRYLKIDGARSEDFVATATILLDAGADPNSGWFESDDHQPKPEWESVIYGAAGLAHNADLTRLLLERGADPNDAETPYHTAESYDNAAMKVLVQSGKLNKDSLATLLLRKADWHDFEGIKWLLEQGVEPDTVTRWGKTALQQAVLRDNDIEAVRVLLDYGSNPALAATKPERHEGRPDSAVDTAAVRGRGDVLRLFQERGFDTARTGVKGLLAACAVNDSPAIAILVNDNPQLVRELNAAGGMFLCNFAGNGNSEGVRHLLDLGVSANAVSLHGDPYFGVARNSTALHVAAWRARHDTVKLLIDHGANVNAVDAEGRTPLQLAVKACVDSYWMNRRSPESIEMLVKAGASRDGVSLPTGYDAADALLVEKRSI
jgi:ankyrin repeat protein